MSDDNELYVDQDTCIGCALCTSIAANSLTINDDGKCEAINPPGDDNETIQDAIDSCPMQCIHFKKIEK